MKIEKFSKICINCPAGCHLEIKKEGDQISVHGNTCPRGVKYAQQELTDPRRVVTAVIRTAGTSIHCIPVKTDAPLPMAMIPGLLKELFGMRLESPVSIGDIILSDYNGTGINVIATSGTAER